MSLQSDERYYLKLKALYYLYEDNFSQTEIAKLLHISRVTLKRLLDEARKEGMVKIQIVDLKGSLPVLETEKRLLRKTGLKDIKLVDCTNVNENGVSEKIGIGASNYIARLLRSGMSVGFTWGQTLNSMVEYLPENNTITDLCAYTLVGMASENANLMPNIIAEKFIKRYSGTTKILAAPFLCQNPLVCEAIKNEPSYTDMLNAYNNLDFVLVGIGEKPLYNTDRLGDYPFNRTIINELSNSGAVGDICGNFFNIDGSLSNTSIINRLVSIPLEKIREHKNVIAIGGGAKKIDSIIGALNGKYVDILITDLNTAKEVLKRI